MIQKRFKQTEALVQAQEILDFIQSQEVVLAKIDTLPNITIDGVVHTQSLIVRNLNIAISANYIKPMPERIVINQETGKELKGINLYVPDWTITANNVSSHIGQDGQRIMYEREYYDDETGEVVLVDQENNVLPELTPEAFMMPTIPYLMFFTKQIKLPELIQTFSLQFVEDNYEVWQVIGNPTLAKVL